MSLNSLYKKFGKQISAVALAASLVGCNDKKEETVDPTIPETPVVEKTQIDTQVASNGQVLENIDPKNFIFTVGQNQFNPTSEGFTEEALQEFLDKNNISNTTDITISYTHGDETFTGVLTNEQIKAFTAETVSEFTTATSELIDEFKERFNITLTDEVAAAILQGDFSGNGISRQKQYTGEIEKLSDYSTVDETIENFENTVNKPSIVTFSNLQDNQQFRSEVPMNIGIELNDADSETSEIISVVIKNAQAEVVADLTDRFTAEGLISDTPSVLGLESGEYVLHVTHSNNNELNEDFSGEFPNITTSKTLEVVETMNADVEFGEPTYNQSRYEIGDAGFSATLSINDPDINPENQLTLDGLVMKLTLPNGEVVLVDPDSYEVGERTFNYSGNLTQGTMNYNIVVGDYNEFGENIAEVSSITYSVDVFVSQDLLDDFNTALETANTKEQGDYTPETWEAFAIARTTAQELLAQIAENSAQPEEITTALDTLEATMGDLEKVGDIENLTILVSQAQELLTGEYTQISKENLQEAIDEAQSVLDKESPSKSEVESAETSLQAAIDGLEELGDVTTLNELLSTARTALTGNYTASSLTALETAIQTAEAVVGNENRTPSEVESAETLLQSAIDGLEVLGDVTTLNQTLSTARAELTGNYTEESKAVLQTRITEAESLIDNPNRTQPQVNVANQNLVNAINQLVVNNQAPVTTDINLGLVVNNITINLGDSVTDETPDNLLNYEVTTAPSRGNTSLSGQNLTITIDDFMNGPVNLVVTVTDNGNPQLSSTINISIDDLSSI